MIPFIFLCIKHIGSRSCCILLDKSTDHETSITNAIYVDSILVYSSLSSSYIIENSSATTSFRVPYFCFFVLFFKPSEFLRFPNDNNTLGIDQQFLIGRAILVSPVLVSVNINTQNRCSVTLKIFLASNYSTCLFSTRCLVSISIRCRSESCRCIYRS
jgi:hypothetical protein